MEYNKALQPGKRLARGQNYPVSDLKQLQGVLCLKQVRNGARGTGDQGAGTKSFLMWWEEWRASQFCNGRFL